MVDNLSQEEQNTYITSALIVTLFLFLPVGIFALKYALEAENYYGIENFSDGKKAASKAKKLTIIGFLIGITIYLFGTIGWIYSYSNAQNHINSSNQTIYLITPGKNLSNANLKRADLSQINLSSTDLSNADFSSANLTGANLNSANLSNANFSGANLTGADLGYAKLTGANLDGAIFWEKKFGQKLEAKNITPEQIKKAYNWEKAVYSRRFRKILGIPPQK